MAPEFGVQPQEDGARDDDDAFRRRSEQVAREIARTSGGVILGHAATVILRDSPGVLRVRLDGPLERRLERAGARERVDADAARGEQRVSDYAREQYMRRFYDVDPNDPGLYHLTIDSTSLPPRAVAALIATAAWTLTSSAAPPVEPANGAAPQPALDLGAAS
jgi:cytidylate kinase